METIDITPFWVDIICPLAVAYVEGSVDAKDELLRIARFLDDINAKSRNKEGQA
jgi:hypothetical protein